MAASGAGDCVTLGQTGGDGRVAVEANNIAVSRCFEAVNYTRQVDEAVAEQETVIGCVGKGFDQSLPALLVGGYKLTALYTQAEIPLGGTELGVDFGQGVELFNPTRQLVAELLFASSGVQGVVAELANKAVGNKLCPASVNDFEGNVGVLADRFSVYTVSAV